MSQAAYKFKTFDQTIFYVGGEASTSAIRRTLSMFSLYVRIAVLGLMVTASYHERGCERDQQNGA